MQRRPLGWQTGTVERIKVETYRIKTFTLSLPDWQPFLPGQHFKVRLTAPDGYQAIRSYSIASAPEEEGVVDLTIELIPDGEVSPYFHQVVLEKDEIEVRGPIGGPFTWTAEVGGPLLLIAAGSGIVPLMSMLRHRNRSAPNVPATLLYSSRSLEDIIYREELELSTVDPQVTVVHTLTRKRPSGWKGWNRRIDRSMLQQILSWLDRMPHVYVCGPTPFVEWVATELVDIGIEPHRVRTERFGSSV